MKDYTVVIISGIQWVGERGFGKGGKKIPEPTLSYPKIIRRKKKSFFVRETTIKMLVALLIFGVMHFPVSNQTAINQHVIM